MSKKVWIWMRIFGWIILLSGLISLEVTLIFELFDYRRVSIANGLLSITGTFFVLYGYYQVEKDKL
jgi:hypothetical protein